MASIATTLYVLYLWWTEDLTRWTLGLFLAFVAVVRRARAFRLRMTKPD